MLSLPQLLMQVNVSANSEFLLGSRIPSPGPGIVHACLSARERRLVSPPPSLTVFSLHGAPLSCAEENLECGSAKHPHSCKPEVTVFSGPENTIHNPKFEAGAGLPFQEAGNSRSEGVLSCAKQGRQEWSPRCGIL